jgi:hypothetical protein
MTWGLTAIAVSVGSTAISMGAQNQAALKGTTAGLRQEAENWQANTAENKAIEAANLQNTIRTGYKAGMLNVQQGLARKASLAESFKLGVSGLSALGQQSAASAASGTMGASVDAVVQDIELKLGDAKTAQAENYNVQELNFQSQLHDLVVQGQDSLNSANKSQVARTGEAKTIGFGEAAATLGAQALSMYAMQKMQLKSS